MTYETYRIIFIAGAVACGVMLAVSVLLFFLLSWTVQRCLIFRRRTKAKKS